LDFVNLTISFSKNGKWLGVAFSLPETYRNSTKPLFPHILLKNITCKINFGNIPAATPSPVGYAILDEAKSDSVVNGPVYAASRKDCELVMMIGLPYAGKTRWANEYVQKHPEKNYIILGPDQIYEKMKPYLIPKPTTEVKDGPKKDSQMKSNLQASARSLFGGKLLNTAKHLARNFIFDSTNIWPEMRPKKVKALNRHGKKIAVCVVPNDQVLEQRIQSGQKEKLDSGCVARQVTSKHRARFLLPHKDVEPNKLFDEVIFAEGTAEDAEKVIEGYEKDRKEEKAREAEEIELQKKKRKWNVNKDV